MEAKHYTSQERWNPLEEMLQNELNKHISLGDGRPLLSNYREKQFNDK